MGPFSVRVGQLCSDFYAEAIALQRDLKELGLNTGSDEKDKRRGVALVERIQARSKRFLADLRSVPKPEDPGQRQDAEQLVASTERFLDAQAAMNDPVKSELLRPGTGATKQELEALRDKLNSELLQQQAMMRRLDIPECLPQE